MLAGTLPTSKMAYIINKVQRLIFQRQFYCSGSATQTSYALNKTISERAEGWCKVITIWAPLA